MNKSKLFLGLSAIISLAMSYIFISDYFLYIPYSANPDVKEMVLGGLINVLYSLKYMSAINSILATVFLLNSVSLILYLKKIDTKVEIKKYFSFGCALLLFTGLIAFFIDISCSTIFYEANYEHLTLQFRILKWMPQILEFSIPTLYLLGVQTYMMKKVNSVKLNKKSITVSIYITSIVFLTIMTFCKFSGVLDEFLGHIKLKTIREMPGEHLYYLSEPNIVYYIFYILALTLLFGAIFVISELISRKRRKKQMLKA